MILVVLAAWLAALLPAETAQACSCAEAEAVVPLEDPDSALAVVQRVDAGRGGRGVLRVVQEIGTARLPATFTAPMDRGADCTLGLSQGGVAAIVASRERGGWTVGECREASFGAALAAGDGLAGAVDPDAAAPAAVLTGRFGTAALRVVDTDGRIVAETGDGDSSPSNLRACGPDHVAVSGLDLAGTTVTVLSLPDLAVVAEHDLGDDLWPSGTRCNAPVGGVPNVTVVGEGETSRVLASFGEQTVRRELDCRAGDHQNRDVVGVLDGVAVLARQGFVDGGPTRVSFVPATDRHEAPAGVVVPGSYVDRVLASPDGRLLALAGDGITVVDLGTGGARQIVEPPGTDAAHGTTLVGLRDDGEVVVLVAGADGTGRVVAVDHRGAQRELASTGRHGWEAALRDDLLLRVGGGPPVAHDLERGTTTTWGPLWTVGADELVLLDAFDAPAADTFAAELVPSTPSVPTAQRSTTAADQADGAVDTASDEAQMPGSDGNLAAQLAAAGAIAALVSIVMWSLRTRARRPIG